MAVRKRRRLPPAEAFGQRVRDRRHQLGISQRLLAERAGMDWSYVSQVERGERNIALMNILRLALALEIDAGDLVTGSTPES